MTDEQDEPRYVRVKGVFDDYPRAVNTGQEGWRWWAKVGAILVSSVLAAGLIVFGAVRFLDQAQREHDRAECLRVQLQAEARGNAAMGQVVLDPRTSADQRRAAFVVWSDEQGRIADRIGRC